MGRPVLAALAQQQQIIDSQARTIEALRRQASKQDLVIDFIAKMAGVTNEVTAIRRTADLENPAQPVDNPPEQPATETTEQAATPEAADSPLNPGLTPGSTQHLPAETTGTPMDPGTTLPTGPYTNLTEVTAPVAGTEVGEVPIEQVRTEVDVRVGDPMNLERAFPWNVSPDAQGSSPESGEFAGGAKQAALANRTMASLRLARLQIQAGTATGDDMAVAATIQASAMSDGQIEDQIRTLAGVVKAAARRSQRPAGVVPKSASAQRTAPSLVNAPSQGLVAEASSFATDEDAESLFL